MTITANVAAVWRRIVVFLDALEQTDFDPLAQQQRRIASLEQRLAELEAAHDGP